MGKNKKAKEANKVAVKAAKRKRQAKKIEQKTKRRVQGGGEDLDDDLLTTLEEFRKKWEDEHRVTEDVVDGPPSRRANASLTPDPIGPYLWLFGGEFFDGASAYFYNDFYRFNPDKNEWRRLSSPTFPGPRSAHQVVATPAGGGKLWLFGGEFASVNQTSFHHYRDLWCFDVPTQSWERIETKIKPSARSGHRMVVWKQWIILFGGFHDVGVRTNYLNDLWIFDTLEYKWSQIVPKDMDRWPTARSGFSLLPTTDGIVLHGGYTKKYISKTKWEGLPLDDTYHVKLNTLHIEGGKGWAGWKWEKRKKLGQVPGLRSGATMALWANRNMGVGFGGVHDIEDEESMTSEFYQDLFGYQLIGSGRWVMLNLKKKKRPGAAKRKKKIAMAATATTKGDGYNSTCPDGETESDEDADDVEKEEQVQLRRQEVEREEARAKAKIKVGKEKPTTTCDDDLADPEKSVPLQRYNAMLAVLRNTLYIYGGIYESGDREYTLASFYSIQLDKLDCFACLRDDDIGNHEWNDSGSESNDDSDDETSSSSNGGEVGKESSPADLDIEEAVGLEVEALQGVGNVKPPDEAAFVKTDLRQRAEAFMGVSKSTGRPVEELLSTPLPGETLKVFYDRSRDASIFGLDQDGPLTANNYHSIGHNMLTESLTIVAKNYGGVASLSLRSVMSNTSLCLRKLSGSRPRRALKLRMCSAEPTQLLEQ